MSNTPIVGQNHNSPLEGWQAIPDAVETNPYQLTNHNSLSNREWDGYCSQLPGSPISCDNALNQSVLNLQKNSSFREHAPNAAVHSVDSYAFGDSLNKAEQQRYEDSITETISPIYETREGTETYFVKVVPTWMDYIGSPEKLFWDNMEADLMFADICKTDTTYPYGCNEFHTNVSQNYNTSVSPNTYAFREYQANNTRIQQMSRTVTEQVMVGMMIGYSSDYKPSGFASFNRQYASSINSLVSIASKVYIANETEITTAANSISSSAKTLGMTGVCLVDIVNPLSFCDTYEVITGISATDGSQLQGWERGLALAGLVPVAGDVGKAINKTWKAGTNMIDTGRDTYKAGSSIIDSVKQVNNAIDTADGVYDSGKTVKMLPAPDEVKLLPPSQEIKLITGNTYSSTIVNGHAWIKHGSEFPEINNQLEFVKKVDNTVNQATDVKNLNGGRTAYYNSVDNTLVIVDPRSQDLGTMFRPKNGMDYFNNLN